MKLIPHLGFLCIIILLSNSSPSHQTKEEKNPRLENAYRALSALKKAITSDPQNFTGNWKGTDVCSYNGVFCAKAPDDPKITTVGGLDMNEAGVTATFPHEMCLLTDLALLHINSNKFCGSVPNGFQELKLLFELDLSNNKFTGSFPQVLLQLPSLKYLDIRFNNFSGSIPHQLFNLKLDALFINNNQFSSSLPPNVGNSSLSVLVLANNNFNGCFPLSLLDMSNTLEEMILSNAGLKGCLPVEIGRLNKLKVLDISSNSLVGALPQSISKMKKLEQLNVANNKLMGDIPESICSLPKLENFTYSSNYLCKEPQKCLQLQEKDDRLNCIPNRPEQRPGHECHPVYAKPADCGSFNCGGTSSSWASPSPSVPVSPPGKPK